MKIAILVLVATCFSYCLAYTDTDQKIDYSKLSKDEINQNLDCFLDRGPCTDIQEHYKTHIIDTVRTKCASCTPFHKHNGHMFFEALHKWNPQGLEEFKRKYAPEQGALDKLEGEIKTY